MNKKGLITIGMLLALMLASPFAGSAIIGFKTADQVYQTVEEVPQKEIGLVLGAAAYGDRLSDILQDRVDTAIEAYEAEKVSVLIMSGAPNEADAMKKYAVEHNVPNAAVTEDITGLNTMASISNISELGRSIIIFTQQYHLPRALFLANSMGIDAVGVASDKQPYLKIDQFKSREILATSKAIFDVFNNLLDF